MQCPIAELIILQAGKLVDLLENLELFFDGRFNPAPRAGIKEDNLTPDISVSSVHGSS